MKVVDDALIEKLRESFCVTILSATYNGWEYKKSGSVAGVVVDDDKPELDAVSFSNNLDLISDTESSFGISWQYGPHWIKDLPESTLPVAYSCGNFNNVMTCDPTIFGVVDSTITVEVRFRWSEGGESQWVVWNGGAIYGVELSQAFSEIFGKQQAFYDPITTLTWEYRIDGEEQGEFGENRNPLYVTYSDPRQGVPLYHTVVHSGCKMASGVGGSEEKVFKAIWNLFESRYVTKADLVNGQVQQGDVLKYYGRVVQDINAKYGVRSGLLVRETGHGFVAEQEATLARQHKIFGTVGLLEYRDGTCGSWQDFAVNVFGAQGIQVQEANVDAKSTPGFQVKIDIPGQGGVPNESIWSDHATIRYGNDIYDPSYGVSYGSGDAAKLAFIQQLASIGVGGANVPPTDPLWTQGWRGSYRPTKQTSAIAISDLTFIGWD